MEHEIEFLSLIHFSPFYSTNNSKNQIFEKMKKKLLDISSFYTCASHMTITSCMVSEICSATDRIFCLFGPLFVLLLPLTTQKIKIMKERTKHLEILPFYTCTINENHLMYGSWDRERERQNFFHFGPFFAFLSQKQPEKSKFWKNEKNLWIYHHFTLVYQKSWSYAMLFLRYSAWRMWFLFFILDYFLSFYPPDSPKNQN